MSIGPPLNGLPPRIRILRATLLLATGLGLIASAPAWLNGRSFPFVPIVEWFPILPEPCDTVIFGAMLAMLVTSLWVYRAGVLAFLALALVAFCEDQNRGQPWLYMYWVML